MTRNDIKGVFLLLFFAMITAFLFNHLSPFGIKLFGQWETSKGVITAKSKVEIINNSIEINDIEIIRKIVQKKERIVLDVRSLEEYNQGHLPSALSFPLSDFDEMVGKIFGSINRQSEEKGYKIEKNEE